MINQLSIPDTVDYMIAGYLILSVVLSLYLASIGLRWRKAAMQYRSYKDDQEQE